MTDKPELVCINPYHVLEVWPHVAELIDQACEHYGTKDERKEIEIAVKSGNALLWIAWSASRKIEVAVVTDLVKEDDYLVCRLRALAGSMLSRWIGLLPLIEKYAMDEGCKFVRYVGRRGWTYFMHDYKVTHVIASKRLRD